MKKFFIPSLALTLTLGLAAQSFNSVLIGQQEWMSKNLDVVRFRNGDFIIEAKTLDEWIRAGEKKATSLV